VSGRLDGRVALVTGGGSGIGAAACRALAKEGAAVAVTDLSPEAALAVADSIAAAGGRAKAFAHDVTLPEDWERVVDEVEAAFGRLDILVNNAGMTTVGNELMSHSLENWRRTLSVNLDGVFYGHRYAGPLILKGGRGGSVINISSIMGKIATPGAAAYCASKGAVLMLTKAAALEWAPLGIRVNSVHPGYVETPLVQNILREVENGNEVRETLVLQHALGRLAEPAEIANAIVFLASDESSFMTGSEMVVDGGYTAR
jgi:NAD(P)-dependent dehydrogenase (short-subunit alcohol dehydrogenase family)